MAVLSDEFVAVPAASSWQCARASTAVRATHSICSRRLARGAGRPRPPPPRPLSSPAAAVGSGVSDMLHTVLMVPDETASEDQPRTGRQKHGETDSRHTRVRQDETARDGL